MIKFFKTSIILVLLFQIVTKETFATETNMEDSAESKVAKIVVARAIVYIDEYLLTPLGYVPNGKIIRVGRPRRVNREIVPTIISGRIAYLELKDIEYLDEKTENVNSQIGFAKEHNIDVILKKPEERLNENNSVLFYLGRFDGGSEVARVVKDLEGNNASWLNSIGMIFLHRNPFSRFAWGSGFEYNWIDSGQMNYKMFMISPTIAFTLIRNPAFIFETYFNADISTGAYFKIENNYSDDPSGFAWGPQIGVRLLTTPNNKYRLFGSLSYRSYSLYDMTLLRRYDPNDVNFDVDVTGLSKISGVSLILGIGFDL